jgi:hypothetical protein
MSISDEAFLTAPLHKVTIRVEEEYAVSWKNVEFIAKDALPCLG